MQEFKQLQLPLHDPEGDTKCWNRQHYRSDTEGGPCDGCLHPGWANFKDIRAELARVTAERDTLAQAVHMLRADADKMREQLDALPAQEPAVWECKAGGLRPLTQRQYEAQPTNIQRHYTLIHQSSAPVAAAPVPMTRGQVKALMSKIGYANAPAQHQADFINGIRHAERFHGIGTKEVGAQ